MMVHIKLLNAHKIGKQHGSWYFNLDFSTGIIIRKYALDGVYFYISILGFGFRIYFGE